MKVNNPSESSEMGFRILVLVLDEVIIMKINASATIASLELTFSGIDFTREEMKEFLDEIFTTEWEEEFTELLDENELERSSSIESAMSFNYMIGKEKVLIYGPPLKVLGLAQGFVMAMQNTEGTA